MQCEHSRNGCEKCYPDLSLVKCLHGKPVTEHCGFCGQERMAKFYEASRAEVKKTEDLQIKLAILQAAATLRPHMDRTMACLEARQLWFELKKMGPVE